MDDYIKTWNNIIMNGSFDNTYKMAWAKAIVELSVLSKKQLTGEVCFSFNQIAELFLKYYWNQTIYFDLIQGSNLKKIPKVVGYTKSLINRYYEVKGRHSPERFEKIDFEIHQLKESYNDAILKIIDTLKQDVCYRFMKVGGKEYNIYDLDKKKGIVTLQASQVALLAEYADLLFPIINYRWTQMLESFNNSPRISIKVRAIDDEKIQRKDLSEFYK